MLDQLSSSLHPADRLFRCGLRFDNLAKGAPRAYPDSASTWQAAVPSLHSSQVARVVCSLNGTLRLVTDT